MSDDEDDKIAALNEAQARLAADVDEQLKRLAQEGKLVGLESLLGLISELQALVDKLLATAKEIEDREERSNSGRSPDQDRRRASRRGRDGGSAWRNAEAERGLFGGCCGFRRRRHSPRLALPVASHRGAKPSATDPKKIEHFSRVVGNDDVGMTTTGTGPISVRPSNSVGYLPHQWYHDPDLGSPREGHKMT